MINKRLAVFETNSSSTHSISIDDSCKLLDVIVPVNGKVTMPGNYEFGWDQDTFCDPHSKASYLYIYCMDWSGDKEDEFLKNLISVIKEQTKCENVEFVHNEGGYWPYGYIDHQSVEDCQLHYLLEDKALIRDFIFNPKSILRTDNDNH